MINLPEQALTGIPGIDHQHRALIHWARTINNIDANGATPKIVRRAAQFLIAYARYHFDSEEYSMVAACYDEIAPHNREHKMMRRQLARLAASINNDGDDVEGNVRGLQRLILDWIQNHISHTDMAFARYCGSQPQIRNIELPSPRELKDAGFRISQIDEVETVHHAGEISAGELKARLRIRD